MKKPLNILGIVLGIAFVALAAVYWTTPANALPSFFPGYDPALSVIHFKHGLGALIVGAALLVWVWFRTGKKSSVVGLTDKQ
jgi:hypothetical protein